MPKPIFEADSKSILEKGRVLLKKNRQMRARQEALGDGILQLSASFFDDFNFVDHAKVTVDAKAMRLISAFCDCPASQKGLSLCPHCAALLLRALGEDPAAAPEPAAEPEPVAEPEPAPEAEQPPEPAAEPEPAPEAVQPPEAAGTNGPAENVELPADFAVEGQGDPGPGIVDLSYKFCNCRAHLYPRQANPRIPLERYIQVFGDNLRARTYYEDEKEWGGSCFGMTSSSGLFYQPGNQVSLQDFHRGAAYPKDLELTDVNRGWEFPNFSLHAFIEAMQISQNGELIRIYNRYLRIPLPERIRLLCEKVKNFEATGTKPVIMAVWADPRFHGGHAVFPYRYERLTQLKSRLHIYDPNCPGRVRFCDLRQDSTGKYLSWRFLMSSDKVYSDDRGSQLSMMDYDAFHTRWESRGGSMPTADFVTECEDLTVRDSRGKDMFRIAAGIVTELDENVWTQHPMYGGPEQSRCMVRLPQGSYQVLNDDPETPLAFRLTAEAVAVEVETASAAAVATVNDEKHLESVVLAESGKTFAVRLRTMTQDVRVRGVTGQEKAVLASNADRLLLRNLKEEDIAELRVNDRLALAADHLEKEEQPMRERELCLNNKADDENPDDETV